MPTAGDHTNDTEPEFDDPKHECSPRSSSVDALEFIRILPGRLPGTGVLSHPLPL